jgi:hypothetical protein
MPQPNVPELRSRIAAILEGGLVSGPSSARWLAAIALFWCVGFTHNAKAQRPATMPHSPDLLGIYIGMPAAEAKAQLQKHSADVYVQYDSTNPAQGFGLTLMGEPYDQVLALTTLPPNVSAVWRIERSQHFSNQKPLPRNALLDSLHQKYGKETLSRSPDGGHLELYWIFDADGRLRSQADPGLMECTHPQPGASGGGMYPQCMKEFFGVYVLTNGTADAVQSYTIVLVSDPYEVQAAKATQTKQADDAQHQLKNPTAEAPKF